MCQVVVLPEGAKSPSDLGDDVRLIPVAAGAIALLDEDRATTLLNQVMNALTTFKPTKLLLLADAASALLTEASNVVLGEAYAREVSWSGDVVLENLQDGDWCVFREINIDYSRS